MYSRVTPTGNREERKRGDVSDMLMTDHLGWERQKDVWCRVVSMPTGAWWLQSNQAPECLAGTANFTPIIEKFSLPTGVNLPQELDQALQSLHTVRRYRNPSLWDAIATAVIRQVVRAGQARFNHARLRKAYGRHFTHAGYSSWSLPDPAAMLKLGPELDLLGLKFHRPKLHAAATAYLQQGTTWETLEPTALLQALLVVPGIGPWTAGAAVADYTHDWSLYPYGDLAVRTWVARVAPSVAWPVQENQFAQHWAEMSGVYLSTVTLLVLSCGGLDVAGDRSVEPDSRR